MQKHNTNEGDTDLTNWGLESHAGVWSLHVFVITNSTIFTDHKHTHYTLIECD